jgi:hypothetical protein
VSPPFGFVGAALDSLPAMTPADAREAIDDATALEAEAEAYPGARGEILLDAARAWIKAGRVERGEELLQDVIAHGGEDGAYKKCCGRAG